MSDNLVSMKLTKADRDSSSPMASNEESGPRYPYGLELHLDQEALDKLGEELPDIGEEYRLVATVKVTSVSSHENVGQPARSSVSLQITAMCLENPADDAAGKLYAGTKG